jgi:hypothetical protein
MIKALFALAMMLGLPGQLSAQAPAPRYAEGQVWEYRTRPGEEGSLLRIQRVEPWPAGDAVGRVYHISVIGVRIGGGIVQGEMPHLPVSRETLDASVTRLSTRPDAFPSPEEGIATWREAQGGVFDVPVAEILGFVDRMMQSRQPEPAPRT